MNITLSSAPPPEMSDSHSVYIKPLEMRFLQFLVAAIFLGRAYQAIFFDIPLRAFLWDQRMMEGIVWLFTGWKWQEYATNLQVDILIQQLAALIGVFWIVCAVASCFVHTQKRWLRRLVRGGGALLILLHLLDWKDKFYMWGQLLEHAAQAAAPLLLVWVSVRPLSHRFVWVVKIILAFTFFCHGLFAYGYYPVPGAWIEWCISVFYFPDVESSKLFLKVMGMLDFLAAILLFVRPAFGVAVWYCIIWGTLTALARVVANFYWQIPLSSLHQWAFEMAYRLIHGGLPLLLWWWQKQLDSNK